MLRNCSLDVRVTVDVAAIIRATALLLLLLL
jgi:hypothetical protein